MITRTVLAAVTIASWVTTSFARSEELDVAAFENTALETFHAYEVPGASVAVVKDGKLVLARGFGVRELGRPEIVDADTLFAIASNTKAFTAAALASLVDDGKLAWDDRLVDHMPEFRLFDTYATEKMTVRDLLSHRSGHASGMGDLLWLRSTYSREEIVRRIRFIRPSYGFRSRYGYQNVMFIAAGELAEAVSGTSWDELMVARLFVPLGMSTANTTIRARTPGGNWAVPHVRVKGTVQPISPENVDNLGGAGSINASANDLSRWLLLQLGRGEIDGVRVYSEDRAEEMWRAVTPIPLGSPAKELEARHPSFSAYGLGWRLKDYRGRKLVHHGGGLAGMTSLTTLVPEHGLGIVILTNQETSAQTALTYWLLDTYLDAPRTDWTEAQRRAAERRWRRIEPRVAAVDEARVTSTSPRLALDAYAGRYVDTLYGDATIDMDATRLRLRFVNSPAFDAPLEHWHYDTFVARFDHHSIPDAFVTFSLGVDGNVERLRMKPFSPAADASTYHFEALDFVREADDQ